MNPHGPHHGHAGGYAMRRRRTFLRSIDDDGIERLTPESLEETTLAPDGSLETTVVKAMPYACRCGPDQPTGARCTACGRWSCQRCSRTCEACRAPVCPEHSRLVEHLGGRVAMCSMCAGDVARRRLAASTIRLLLSPFITFKSGGER